MTARPMTPTAPPPTPDPQTATSVPVSAILRLEAGALFIAGIVAYAHLGGGWGTFALLILIPDLGLLGYLIGTRTGAATYNLTHTLVLPLLLAITALLLGSPRTGALAAIWLAHIGIDRAVGYGLKYPTDFRDTHLQRVTPHERPVAIGGRRSWKQ